MTAGTTTQRKAGSNRASVVPAFCVGDVCTVRTCGLIVDPDPQADAASSPMKMPVFFRTRSGRSLETARSEKTARRARRLQKRLAHVDWAGGRELAPSTVPV